MHAITKQLGGMARRLLEGCVAFGYDGTKVYRPNVTTEKEGYQEFWGRDTGMMMQNAPEFFTADELVQCTEFYMRGARAEDGWLPDRIGMDGYPTYSAGARGFPVGLANLDTAPYTVLMADAALQKLAPEEAELRFKKWYPLLLRGMEAVETDERGLVYNDPTKPHSPWGFTDTVAKTGSLMMESVLMWQAYGVLSKWMQRFDMDDAALKDRMQAIVRALPECFGTEEGMLLAATQDCRQLDVIGSVYAAAVDFPLEKSLREGIARWMIAHYDQVVQNGQICHTAPGETWQRLLIDVKPGEYQNGAYWGFASGWAALAIAPYDPALAERLLTELTAYYQREGIFECVNGSYRKLDEFVVSATNPYGAAKMILKEKG